MTYFIQSGDTFIPAPSKESLLEGLPVGIYTIELSQSGPYFKRGESFQALPKLYGKLDSWGDRIVNSFASRPGNTGVLLCGEKGSGKSLLGRVISHKAAALDMPTILINKSFDNVAIIADILGELSSPAVVFMDEFEKVFANPSLQENMLGLLDGTHRSRHLFVLTANDSYRVDMHMKNRPGRLFYNIDFKGLEESFIQEYCEQNLNNEEWINDVVRVSRIFENFNFDMLQALVEESNRYQEPPLESLKLLNITPVGHGITNYRINLVNPDGKDIPLWTPTYSGSPMEISSYRPDLLNDDEDPAPPVFSSTDMIEFSFESGLAKFKSEEWTLTFEREKKATSPMHWASAF